MSFLPLIARMLIEEHKRLPITGDLLTIGRQSVPFDQREAKTMLASADVALRDDYFVEMDLHTVGAHPTHITDRSFVSMFTDARLISLDASSYEGATVIHDLNKPLPDHLHGIADFIFDGSCLDNIFNTAEALASFTKMLRPGGRLFMFEHGSLIQSAFLAFSPEYFSAWCKEAGYSDVRVWTPAWQAVLHDLRDYRPWSAGVPSPAGDFICVVCATRGEGAVEAVAPMQSHYEEMHSAA